MMPRLLTNTAAKIAATVFFALAVGGAFLAGVGINIVFYSSAFQVGDEGHALYQKLLPYQDALVPLLIFCLVIGLVTLVFLLCAAGRVKDQPGISLNFLDRIPFDLYLLLDVLLFFAGAALFESVSVYYLALSLPLSVLVVMVEGLLVLAFLLTCSSRFKAGQWWRNSIIYRWLAKPASRFIRWLWRQLRQVFANIALLWKGILTYCAFILLAIIFFFNAVGGSALATLLLTVLGIAGFLFVCSLSLQMNTLKQCASKIAAGDLDYRIDTRNMYQDLKEHGQDLNRISEGLLLAVDERMKSERFKTELITNVSHDLKTPLTSIINYVDLLQKEDIANPQARQYLEVLARQSSRLKKLTEDLIEASKASTGNIHMDLTVTDMSEFINQIMGEYQERFKSIPLQSVVTVPEERVYILADGRSLWRVFDNLLNNICKYSQPNTRVFIEMKADAEQVVVSLKNTSRELLNIPVEDLLERFVRADSSRTSEGSGLGLSIARSLTELQHGSLELQVDGDLFKVIISFARLAH